MCGIAGIAGSDPTVIERMTKCLVHRGPDGNAVWCGENVCMGHARLAILDPRPDGNQPMWNSDHTVGIVFNGEIYNYRELREREDLRCKTNTDTEVLLKLYEKFGIAFVRKLHGMFAFGLYDARSKTWYLARDHKGIKPLYVAYPEGKLAFASEMRALMAAMPTKPALNMRSLSRYMRLQYVPGPETLCEGIELLAPGTILTWQDGSEKRQVVQHEEHAAFGSNVDFLQRFPEMMDTVVKQHLVSDKPVGLFLSGGMDSSILLHHMAKHTDKPVKTFTVKFDATEAEDAKRFNADAALAAQTARHYGTEHQEIVLSAQQFLDTYPQTVQALDQPNANAIAVAQFVLAREAKKHVDVALSGLGGDELFGGYPRYRIARILQTFGFAPPPLRALGAKLTGYPADVLAMKPGPHLAERLLARPAAEGKIITRGDWFQSDATTHLFEERFAQISNSDPVQAFMEFDRTTWMVDEALRMADGTTMGSGLECRVPFVDERVMAAAHAVPSAWHVTLSNTKTLLKDTYRPILPEHLFNLQKASFFSPIAKWLRRETAPLMEHALMHPRIQELFDVAVLRAQFTEHKDKQAYHLHTLSSIIQLAYWFDAVYDA